MVKKKTKEERKAKEVFDEVEEKEEIPAEEVEKAEEKKEISTEKVEKVEENLSALEKEETDEEAQMLEQQRLFRLKQAESGTISDPRVFHLMYLDKCAVEASLQIQVRKTAYRDRIEALKQELSQIIRQWETLQKQKIRKISDIRREIEEDYGIYFNNWGYDDETGVLVKALPEVVQNVDSQEEDGKLKETDSGKSATDRGSGAK